MHSYINNTMSTNQVSLRFIKLLKDFSIIILFVFGSIAGQIIYYTNQSLSYVITDFMLMMTVLSLLLICELIYLINYVYNTNVSFLKSELIFINIFNKKVTLLSNIGELVNELMVVICFSIGILTIHELFIQPFN